MKTNQRFIDKWAYQCIFWRKNLGPGVVSQRVQNLSPDDRLRVLARVKEIQQ